MSYTNIKSYIGATNIGEGESELDRAVRFYGVQRLKGWSQQEVMNQIEGSYGKRVKFFVNSLIITKELF